MKMVNKFGIVLSALLLTAGTAVHADEAIKIGTVNVQQVLQQSPRVTNVSKKLEGDFKARQAKISDEQKTLQDKLEKFKKDSLTMSAKDKQSTEKKIAAERSDLVAKVVAYQQDLQKEQNKAMQSILSDLNGVVSGIAKNQHLALVLDSQAVIYSDSVDITKAVIDGFNHKS